MMIGTRRASMTKDETLEKTRLLESMAKQLIAKWRTEADEYPGTVIGQYAATAVRLCADELAAWMDDIEANDKKKQMDALGLTEDQ
jgi:hypothetical protein